MSDPDTVSTATNPLCGDSLNVAVRLDRSGSQVRVGAVGFTGQGCSISQASASMMTELVRGRTPRDVAVVRDRLGALLRGDPGAAADETLGPLRAFSGVARVPARIPCALMAWDALLRALGES